MSREGAEYLGRMASSAFVVALLAGASAYSGHHAADLPALLGYVGSLMLALNLAGAYAIFRPIERFLHSVKELPEMRIRRLAVVSAAWVFGLAAATISLHLARSHGSLASLLESEPGSLLLVGAHIAVFSIAIALYVYFVVNDFVVSLRTRLWHRHRLKLEARPGRLMTQLCVGFAGVASAPLLMLFSDASLGEPGASAESHHAMLRQALELDLLASALLAVVMTILLVRSISRPVSGLIATMASVDAGDLKVRAPVVADNELGELAERFNLMLDGLAERERMRRTFNRFVPEEVAGALIADEGAILPQEREATILFADIENFTDTAARLEPRQVLDLLNEYFSGVAAAIHGNGGVIMQFQGDAVLAGFNLPDRMPDYARRAVRSAEQILAEVDPRPLTAGIRLRTRIGISTGRVVGGTVGGGERLGYTIHGDTVNRAARLQAMNKELGTRILLCARTAELLGDWSSLRGVGRHRLRGLGEAMPLFEVAGPDVPATSGAPRAARG